MAPLPPDQSQTQQKKNSHPDSPEFHTTSYAHPNQQTILPEAHPHFLSYARHHLAEQHVNVNLPSVVAEENKRNQARILLLVASALYASELSFVKKLNESVPVGISLVLRFGLASLAVLPLLFSGNDGGSSQSTSTSRRGFCLNWNNRACGSKPNIPKGKGKIEETFCDEQEVINISCHDRNMNHFNKFENVVGDDRHESFFKESRDCENTILPSSNNSREYFDNPSESHHHNSTASMLAPLQTPLIPIMLTGLEIGLYNGIGLTLNSVLLSSDIATASELAFVGSLSTVFVPLLEFVVVPFFNSILAYIFGGCNPTKLGVSRGYGEDMGAVRSVKRMKRSQIWGVVMALVGLGLLEGPFGNDGQEHGGKENSTNSAGNAGKESETFLERMGVHLSGTVVLKPDVVSRFPSSFDDYSVYDSSSGVLQFAPTEDKGINLNNKVVGERNVGQVDAEIISNTYIPAEIVNYESLSSSIAGDAHVYSVAERASTTDEDGRSINFRNEKTKVQPMTSHGRGRMLFEGNPPISSSKQITLSSNSYDKRYDDEIASNTEKNNNDDEFFDDRSNGSNDIVDVHSLSNSGNFGENESQMAGVDEMHDAEHIPDETHYSNDARTYDDDGLFDEISNDTNDVNVDDFLNGNESQTTRPTESTILLHSEHIPDETDQHQKPQHDPEKKHAWSSWIKLRKLLCILPPIMFALGFYKIEHAMERYPTEAKRVTAAHIIGIFFVTGLFYFLSSTTESLNRFSTITTNNDAMNPMSTATQILKWLTTPTILFQLLWSGIASIVVGIYLEALAMKILSASESVVIFSTEPIFASAIASWFCGELFLGGSWPGVLGATCIIAGCVVSELGLDCAGWLDGMHLVGNCHRIRSGCMVGKKDDAVIDEKVPVLVEMAIQSSGDCPSSGALLTSSLAKSSVPSITSAPTGTHPTRLRRVLRDYIPH